MSVSEEERMAEALPSMMMSALLLPPLATSRRPPAEATAGFFMPVGR